MLLFQDFVAAWVVENQEEESGDRALHPVLTLPTLGLAVGLLMLPPAIAILALLGFLP